MKAIEFFREWSKEVLRTAPNNDETSRLTNAALGLAGESGEVADIIKKCIFQGHELDKEKLLEELGDVLWYVEFMCSCIGINTLDAMTANREKLRKRYPNGFSEQDSINRKG